MDRLAIRDDNPWSRSTSTSRDEETEKERIQRLGRERPAQFESAWSEIAFCYSVLMSIIMTEYYISGFNVLIPTVQEELHIAASAAVWPAAAFALTTSAFLLPFGRLADMFGGKTVYMYGLIWFLIWSIVAGFSRNELMLNLCRALQGLGPAAVLPSGVGLLGSQYRPGPRKNRVFSVYGGSAPLGFFLGILVAGAAGSYLDFGWFFWIGAVLLVTTIIAAFYAVHKEERRNQQIEMDWWGSALSVIGLILTVFALTDGSHAPQKWLTPYIIVTLVVGVLALGAAWYVEGYVARQPLVPFSLFKVPYVKPLFAALFLNYGCLGVFILFAVRYSQDVLGATTIQLSAWFVPMCAGGVILSLLGGWIMHIIPGSILMGVASCGWILAGVMFAISPADANYWAYVFPAMIGATIGIDIAFNVATVFISTSISEKQQGLAGSICHQLLYLGIAVMLAFADVTETQTAGLGQMRSYHTVFWFMLACAGVSFVIMVFFVRIPKAESDLTADEREALLRAREGGGEMVLLDQHPG